MIRDMLDDSPAPDKIRVIYRGRVLEGPSTLTDTLSGLHVSAAIEPVQTFADCLSPQEQESHTLHLVIRQDPQSAPVNTPASESTSSVRTEDTSPGDTSTPSTTRSSTTTTTTTSFTRTTGSNGQNQTNRFDWISNFSSGTFPTDTEHDAFHAANDAFSRSATDASPLSELHSIGAHEDNIHVNPPPRFDAGLSVPPTSTFGGPRFTAAGNSTRSARVTEILPTPEEIIARNQSYIEGLHRGSIPETSRIDRLIFSTSSPSGDTNTPAALVTEVSSIEETAPWNQEFMDILRRGSIPEIAPMAPPRSEQANARDRALQDSFREFGHGAATGLFSDPAQTYNSVSTPGAGQPLTLTQQIIPHNSLVYLLQDQYGRPHSLLVGPPGSIYQAPPYVQAGETHPFPLNSYFHPASQSATPAPTPTTAASPRPTPPQPHAVPLPARNPPAPQPGAVPIVPPAPPVNNNNAENNFPNMDHFWIAVRLVVFYWIFVSHTPPLVRALYGLALFLIFLWKSGVLNNYMRPLLEAIVPPPPPAAARQRLQEPIDPEHTARLLVQRRQAGVRNTVRNLEQSAIVFVASLVPSWYEGYAARRAAEDRLVQQAQQRLEQVEQERRDQRNRSEREQRRGQEQAEQQEPESLI